MSTSLRRGCFASALIFGAQALAFAALAQQPAGHPSSRDTSDRPHATSERMTPPAAERSSANKQVSPQEFVSQAAVIGKAEIELGQLALQKSSNEEVRQYAQRMVKDHKAADVKLRQIATQENIKLPETLDAEHQAVKQKLSSLQGEEFDREYRKVMAKGHDKAVALFESASRTQQLPPPLKEFAASTLPTLEQHQEQAHSLRDKGGA